MATLKRDYTCAPEGHTIVTFPAGSEVTGKVAEWARQDGAVEKTKRNKKKATRKPDETKPSAPKETK